MTELRLHAGEIDGEVHMTVEAACMIQDMQDAQSQLSSERKTPNSFLSMRLAKARRHGVVASPGLTAVARSFRQASTFETGGIMAKTI
ncbi:hypothetical protein [Labrys sp. ZIDIC5]|uniref:hypothetical protein n=1 Tax=Labrys sedimenti TaxID=3106036 RepID=UPI002ACAD9DB|nr:hypothetical protein [Labrys sp. ZIDIC5]MDZ5451633.1 hypothetical protein [Labrys sp. ZIDIC5]